nr:hypothetical protein [Bacteroides intestinalis]
MIVYLKEKLLEALSDNSLLLVFLLSPRQHQLDFKKEIEGVEVYYHLNKSQNGEDWSLRFTFDIPPSRKHLEQHFKDAVLLANEDLGLSTDITFTKLQY